MDIVGLIALLGVTGCVLFAFWFGYRCGQNDEIDKRLAREISREHERIGYECIGKRDT